MRDTKQFLARIGVPASSLFAQALRIEAEGMLPPPAAQGSPEWLDYCEACHLLARAGRPIAEAELKQWLAGILAGTKLGNLREGDVIDGHLRAMVFALAGKPVFLFGTETQRAFLLKFEFFPTAAEVWRELSSLYYDYEFVKGRLNWLLNRRIDEALPTTEELMKLGAPGAVSLRPPVVAFR